MAKMDSSIGNGTSRVWIENSIVSTSNGTSSSITGTPEEMSACLPVDNGWTRTVEGLKAEIARQMNHDDLLSRISDQDHIIGQLQGNVEGYAMRCHQLEGEKERVQAEAAAHIAMLRHAFNVVSENTSENDTGPLYDLVDEIDGYIATCDTAGASLLDEMRKYEAVVEAAKTAFQVADTLLAHIGAQGHYTLYNRFCELQLEFLAALAELKGGEYGHDPKTP